MVRMLRCEGAATEIAQRTDQVEEQLSFGGPQVKWLLDRLEADIQRLQLVDDFQRPLQPARQPVNLVNIEYLEQAAPGIIAHGIDARTKLFPVSGLRRVGKRLDDVDSIPFGLVLYLAQPAHLQFNLCFGIEYRFTGGPSLAVLAPV
jgi:hypothetical protein